MRSGLKDDSHDGYRGQNQPETADWDGHGITVNGLER